MRFFSFAEMTVQLEKQQVLCKVLTHQLSTCVCDDTKTVSIV